MRISDNARLMIGIVLLGIAAVVAAVASIAF